MTTETYPTDDPFDPLWDPPSKIHPSEQGVREILSHPADEDDE